MDESASAQVRGAGSDFFETAKAWYAVGSTPSRPVPLAAGGRPGGGARVYAGPGARFVAPALPAATAVTDRKPPWKAWSTSPTWPLPFR
ncbi:hypothetical protein GCM10010508_42990 [Streptomyces naganishii JCM 4654]|uniref:Uncharacterized protein n=1 Tax=Streptomyces naganishii JCM 4654 TaxID=1306179 RepID=A0A918Y638_9ACTN|nr:hypothetical protein GCM10010508_42990 [Streptomyces naganishii JCM 4654]